MRQIKRNPQEFDCERCGNPLMKSRIKDGVKCRWCGYINVVGKFEGKGRRSGNGYSDNARGKKDN